MKKSELFKNSVFGGFAWAIGVTLGFAFISILVIATLNVTGSIPVIGDFIADVIEATQLSLITRTPLPIQ